jgi:hypothetical protein
MVTELICYPKELDPALANTWLSQAVLAHRLMRAVYVDHACVEMHVIRRPFGVLHNRCAVRRNVLARRRVHSSIEQASGAADHKLLLLLRFVKFKLKTCLRHLNQLNSN